jgi:hypothetical protein
MCWYICNVILNMHGISNTEYILTALLPLLLFLPPSPLTLFFTDILTRTMQCCLLRFHAKP